MTGRLKFWFIAAAIGTLPLIILAFVVRPTAAAGLWYVAPGGADSADCQTAVTPCATINAAIGKAGPGDTINVASGTYTAGSGNQVVWITQSVTLLGGWDNTFATRAGQSQVDGEGARRGMTVIDTASARVDSFLFVNGHSFEGGAGISNSGSLLISESGITGNSTFCAWPNCGAGGGLFNTGNLTITRSLISGNSAAAGGGGLANVGGRATIVSSTVSGNAAGPGAGFGVLYGDGIVDAAGDLWIEDSTINGNGKVGAESNFGIYSTARMTVTNSTVSGNLGDGVSTWEGQSWFYNVTIGQNSSGGLILDYGTTTLQNSLFSGNGAGSYGSTDCSSLGGVLLSNGHNLITHDGYCGTNGADLIGLEAELDDLRNNGGAAATDALLPGSPAINAGAPSGCAGPHGLLITDERGRPRLGRCDIGAFEVQPLEYSEMTVNPLTTLPGQPARYTLSLKTGGSSNINGVAVTDTLPVGLSYLADTLSASSGSAGYVSGVITWTGTVDTGAPVTIQFGAASQPSAGLGTVLTNTATIKGDGEIFSRQVSLTLATARLYLPLIVRPQPGIRGYVTVNGSPASGVVLELRHFDGQSFSTQLTTSTDGYGFYDFSAAPSLPAGQFYYIRYLNINGTPGYLSLWQAPEITSYAPGQTVVVDNFDLADVALAAPDPGATVGLPALFQWLRRPATPSDSYQLSLFDPGGTAFGQTGLLGYVNELTLTGVPSDFHAGKTYGWYVAVNSPDGGYGESYYYRTVRFNNVLAPSQPSVAGGVLVVPPHAPVDRPRR